MSSLPVPDSPRTSTGTSDGATRFTSSTTRCMPLERATIPGSSVLNELEPGCIDASFKRFASRERSR